MMTKASCKHKFDRLGGRCIKCGLTHLDISKSSVQVEFRDEYPTGHVAEHEVFMSFNGDDEAIDFHEWWDDEGKSRFESWRMKRKDASYG